MAEVAGLDAGVVDSHVILVCSDGEIKVHRRSCALSSLLKSLLVTNPNASRLEVKQIKLQHMKLIATYLDHYEDKVPKSIPVPLPSAELKDACDPWDVEFLAPYDKPETVFIMLETMKAANFMGIESLTKLIGAKFATFLKTKNCEEMKKLLGITNSLTPQQENEIRKKYPEYFAWLKPPVQVDEKTDD